MEGSFTFWGLWWMSLAIFAWPVYRAWRRPDEVLGLPFVTSLFGGYFYVFMAYKAATHLADEVQLWTRELGQFVIVISAASLFAGWYLGTGRSRKIPSEVAAGEGDAKARVAWRTGLAIAWFGVGVNAIWLASGAGFETVAYWYMAAQCVYPGAALCILALLRAKHLRSVLRTVLVVAPIIMVGAPQFFAARRGPTIAWALLILGCYGFSGKSRFRFIVTVVALAFTGLLAVSLLAMRSELEEGTGFFQALRNIEHKDVVSDRTEQVPDNEYAYHCGLVGTVYQTGFYQYGTKTLMLLAHWVPRKYWPGKPGRGQGLFSDIAQDAMPTTVSIDMGPSMSAAGFAHAFEDFGFFCVLFWFLFGLVCAKIYMRALYSHSYLWQAAWLNILSAAHWLIAQDFGAFFVPMMLAQGAMLAFWFLVTQATGTGAPNPRARRRRRIMANPKGIPPQSPGL